MRTMCTLALVLLATPLVAQAQTPIPLIGGERVGFTQPAASLAEAQAFLYRVYVDGSRPATGSAPVACTGTTSPFACEATIPTLSVGPHSLTLTAARVIDGSTQAESLQSAPLAVEMLSNAGQPPIPTQLRIIRPGG